jgi:hypothetical protein
MWLIKSPLGNLNLLSPKRLSQGITNKVYSRQCVKEDIMKQSEVKYENNEV